MCGNEVTIAVCGEGRTAAAVAAGLGWLGHAVACSPELPRAELSAEPGLGDACADLLRSGRLRCSRAAARTVFVCGADRVSELDGRAAVGGTVVNSCLPPWGSTPALASALGRADLRFVSHPLTLRRGSALRDFLAPECLVLGSDDPAAVEAVAGLYAAVPAPVVRADPRTADLVGPARDGLCAVKQQFFAELERFCRAVGADVGSVVECLRVDQRIGRPHTCAATDRLDPGQRRRAARLRALAGDDVPPTFRALDVRP